MCCQDCKPQTLLPDRPIASSCVQQAHSALPELTDHCELCPDHANVPEQELRILMEWCDAGSLMTALEDGRLPPVGAQGNPEGFEPICTTLLEVALAMHHLHAMHIIHCDLKAKNVLLSSTQVLHLRLVCSVGITRWCAGCKAGARLLRGNLYLR